MGANKSKTKYVLLYGVDEAGKTLFQYNLQSSLNVFKDIEPTEGFNYEETAVGDTNVGIFDVSGNLKQYEIVNIVAKCVNISGIIFMVPLDRIEELDKSKEILKLILGNNHLKDRISLLVVYNLKNPKVRDRLSWMPESLLNKRLSLDKLKKTFNLNEVTSIITDVSINLNGEKTNFNEVLENFVDNLDKEAKEK